MTAYATLDFAWLHAVIGTDDGDILWWQMCLRAVVVFLTGLLLVRVAGSRTFGKWGALDILLAVIIGSNLSRALTGNAPFVPTLLASLVVILLHAVFAYGAVWLDPLGGWVKGRPARLMKGGELDRRAMRRHAIGDGDLEQALRASGHEGLEDVRAIYLERNCAISVISTKTDAKG